MGWVWDGYGMDLCVGLLYEHRFAVLIITADKKPKISRVCCQMAQNRENLMLVMLPTFCKIQCVIVLVVNIVMFSICCEISVLSPWWRAGVRCLYWVSKFTNLRPAQTLYLSLSLLLKAFLKSDYPLSWWLLYEQDFIRRCFLVEHFWYLVSQFNTYYI